MLAALLIAFITAVCACACIVLLCALLFAPGAPVTLKILLAALLSLYYGAASLVFGMALILLESAQRLMAALTGALEDIIAGLMSALKARPLDTEAAKKAGAAAFAARAKASLEGTPKHVLSALVLVFALLGFAAPGFIRRNGATAAAVLGGLHMRLLLFKGLVYLGLLLSFLLPLLILP